MNIGLLCDSEKWIVITDKYKRKIKNQNDVEEHDVEQQIIF